MPLLSEILDVKLDYLINLDDNNSLTKIYSINGEKIPGNECVAKFITSTLIDSYSEYDTPVKEKNTALFKIFIDDVKPSDKETPLTIGPNRYLTITYKTKVRSGHATKYHMITENGSMAEKDTWESYLRPSIFFEIINNEKVMAKLKKVKLSDFLDEKKQKNSDMTTTRYEYKFYDKEKQEWADNDRLIDVRFKDGQMYISIDMPVFEEKVPPKKETDSVEQMSF